MTPPPTRNWDRRAAGRSSAGGTSCIAGCAAPLAQSPPRTGGSRASVQGSGQTLGMLRRGLWRLGSADRCVATGPVALTQFALVELAGGRPRQLVHEVDRAKAFVRG